MTEQSSPELSPPVTKKPASNWRGVAFALLATNVLGLAYGVVRTHQLNQKWGHLYKESTQENEQEKVILALRNGNELSCSDGNWHSISLSSPEGGRYTLKQALNVIDTLNRQDEIHCSVYVRNNPTEVSVTNTSTTSRPAHTKKAKGHHNTKG